MLTASGILLHVDESFFQILEGEAEVLAPLYERIVSDSRHQKILKLIHDDIVYPPSGDDRIPFMVNGWALVRRAGADTPATRIDFSVPNGTLSHDDRRKLFATVRR